MTLVHKLQLISNPFEHYTAETEPNIAQYAVRPPYLQAISDRVHGLSSFILFGDRGAGKSATRITVYKEVWKGASNQSAPQNSFIVNLTDYSYIQEPFRKDRLTERDIIGIVAFSVIEQMLAWLASLEEAERETCIAGLDKHQRTLSLALLRGFYLSIPEMDRELSTSDALKLLNSAWTTKSAIWTTGRWEALSKILAAAVNALTKKQMGDDSIDISEPAEALLRSLVGDSPNAPKAILSKLVEFAQAFGFKGICVLVDKVDETPATSNSAEATAKLIHPLLSHIQLLEIPNFSWIFFLWSNVQTHFNAKLAIRLDKIAHANITWDPESLKEMLDKRVSFFSSGTKTFADLFEEKLDPTEVFLELTTISINSPRELIKLMDIIFREHDARGSEAPKKIDRISLEIGQDKYATETIGSWYSKAPLQQVLRLGKTSFINKDVQNTFKIGDQGARVKIKGWEDTGLVRQNGTTPSETGGKQSYRYEVADSRVKRIICRNLDEVVGIELEDGIELD